MKLQTQIYNAFQKMGASSDLLSIIGSIGNTLSNKEVTSLLSDWNSSHLPREQDVLHIRYYKHKVDKSLICVKRVLYYYWDKELRASFKEDRLEYFQFRPKYNRWEHVPRVTNNPVASSIDISQYDLMSYEEVDKYKDNLIMMESLSS